MKSLKYSSNNLANLILHSILSFRCNLVEYHNLLFLSTDGSVCIGRQRKDLSLLNSRVPRTLLSSFVDEELNAR